MYQTKQYRISEKIKNIMKTYETNDNNLHKTKPLQIQTTHL